MFLVDTFHLLLTVLLAFRMTRVVNTSTHYLPIHPRPPDLRQEVMSVSHPAMATKTPSLTSSRSVGATGVVLLHWSYYFYLG